MVMSNHCWHLQKCETAGMVNFENQLLHRCRNCACGGSFPWHLHVNVKNWVKTWQNKGHRTIERSIMVRHINILSVIPRKLFHTDQMVSKGQSPSGQLETGLRFMLLLAMKIAGAILHLLYRLCVSRGHPSKKEVTKQPNPAACAEMSCKNLEGLWVPKPTARS